MPSIKKCNNNSDCERLNRFRTKNKYICDQDKKICTKQKNYSISYSPEKNTIHNYKQSPTEVFFTKITYFNVISNKHLLKINRINTTDLKKLIANHSSIIKVIDKFYDIPQSEMSSGTSRSPKGTGTSVLPETPKGSGSPKGSRQEFNEIKNIKANITANKKHFEDALVYKTTIENSQKKLVEKNVREIMTSISGQLRELIVNPVDWGNLDWYQRFKHIKTIVNHNKFLEIPDNVRLLLR